MHIKMIKKRDKWGASHHIDFAQLYVVYCTYIYGDKKKDMK